MIEVVTLHALKDNFVYALIGASGVAVVDPGDAAPVRAFLEARGRPLTHVLLTHHHADHVDGAAELARSYGAEVICSRVDRPRIAAATRAVDDGDEFTVLDAPVNVIATPGHTAGQVAYWFAREGALFTGDTLFSAGCGRLFEGTADEMFGSMRRLDRLAPDARVYFGHEYTMNNLAFVDPHLSLAREPARLAREVGAYRAACAARLAAGRPTTPSTLATERLVNPFLNARDVAEFTRWREARNRW